MVFSIFLTRYQTYLTDYYVPWRIRRIDMSGCPLVGSSYIVIHYWFMNRIINHLFSLRVFDFLT